MKSIILSLGLLTSSVSANIVFPWYQPSCQVHEGTSYTGCLRGQHCNDEGRCEASGNIVYAESFTNFKEHIPNELVKRATQYSVDGKCGPNNGGLLCDPNSPNYSGTCCSQYGWCGNSAAHCGVGCTSGCSGIQSSAPPATPSGAAPRDDGRCGPNFGNAVCDANGPYGGCCSSYGYCGSTAGHCLVSNGCISGCTSPQSVSSSLATKTSSAASTGGQQSAAPRTDGRCGSGFGGATCDPAGPYGGCCSSYGYCGNTDGHCLVSNGCQNGCTGQGATNPPPATTTAPQSTTTGEPVIAGPTSGPATGGVATKDGTCGANYAGTVCGSWPQGSCCSMYGYCGNSTAHCGDGCQSGPCLNGAVAPAPGPQQAPMNANPGIFNVVGQSGVPAMHAALLPNGKVVFLDKVENYTQLKLPNGQFAYSSEYDLSTNQAVPLSYKSNAFCSGGTFLPDGRLANFGGNAPLDFIDPTVGNGFNAIRYLSRSATDPSLNGQSWSEPGNKISSNRWYGSAVTLGDGTVFLCSGSLNGLDPTVKANNNPTYEILNAQGISSGQSISLPILVASQPYYMYPFVHLMPTGDLFIFAAKSSQLFSIGGNAATRTFPDLAGDFRTYPNTGGSVMLPLSSANNYNPEIVICGGGPYQDTSAPTDPSCGRIAPLSANPSWQMESMPEGRVMVEGTLLLDGTVLWCNGGSQGAQGFGLGRQPDFEALIYDPTKAVGQRFTVSGASQGIARLYHSVALLTLNGDVLIAGSNPVEQPKLQPDATDPYVTEFRVEIYTPPYLIGNNANKRPTNVKLAGPTYVRGSSQTISFTAPTGNQAVKVALYYGGFVTHSVHMGERMIYLDVTGFKAGQTAQTIQAAVPGNANVLPPGPYRVYVVVDGIPSVGQFVMVQ